jgi:branched-chain amino acid transport system permease protein
MVKVLIDQISSSLVIGFTYALVALGFNLIFGILGIVHFAHFEVYMVGAFIGLMGAIYLRMNIVFVFLFAMIGAGILGIFIEKIAFKPIRQESTESQLFASIAIGIILQNTGLMVWGTEWTPFPELIISAPISLGIFQFTNIQIAIFGIVFLLLVSLRLILFNSKIGIAVRAVSFNRDAAILMGINPDTIISISFGFASMLAGAAGVIMGMYYHMIYPLMGSTTGLKAFVAVVIGGIGSLPGSVVGGIILGLAEGLGAAYISSTWRDGIAFSIFILVLLFKPSGLFKVKSDEKF